MIYTHTPIDAASVCVNEAKHKRFSIAVGVCANDCASVGVNDCASVGASFDNDKSLARPFA